MTTAIESTSVTLELRTLDAALGALELFGIYLGTRLGLYDALRQQDAMTPDQVADAAGIAPRYAREWLEQQAVAGVLTVDDVTAAAGDRRFALPEAHVGVVADPVALDHLRASDHALPVAQVAGSPSTVDGLPSR
jgi:hypothetical protein